MPRIERYWRPGAQYHIVCRGNRKHLVFRKFDDYNAYLLILGKTKEKYPFKLLSYCLMPNHVHLQLITGEDHISEVMKFLNQRYAMYVNKEYDLVGRLFQGRFKSVNIESEASMYHVSRYIHMNPVEASMVAKPESYMWSSYNGYKVPGVNRLLDSEVILNRFHTFENYDRYVNAYRKKKVR